MAEIAAQLDATILFDPREALQREVRDVRVAAMSVEHFIENLVDGALVIVPGDGPDILVTAFASTISAAIPTVSGVVLTGGYPPSETVRRLLASAPFPCSRPAAHPRGGGRGAVGSAGHRARGRTQGRHRARPVRGLCRYGRAGAADRPRPARCG